jgi:hypothetical protein
MNRLEDRLEKVDDRVQRQFVWIVGMQTTVMVVVIAALFQVVVRT